MTPYRNPVAYPNSPDLEWNKVKWPGHYSYTSLSQMVWLMFTRNNILTLYFHREKALRLSWSSRLSQPQNDNFLFLCWLILYSRSLRKHLLISESLYTKKHAY